MAAWESDPKEGRYNIRLDALNHLRRVLMASGVDDRAVNDAVAELRAAIGVLSTAHYPTEREYALKVAALTLDTAEAWGVSPAVAAEPPPKPAYEGPWQRLQRP